MPQPGYAKRWRDHFDATRLTTTTTAATFVLVPATGRPQTRKSNTQTVNVSTGAALAAQQQQRTTLDTLLRTLVNATTRGHNGIVVSVRRCVRVYLYGVFALRATRRYCKRRRDDGERRADDDGDDGTYKTKQTRIHLLPREL